MITYVNTRGMSTHTGTSDGCGAVGRFTFLETFKCFKGLIIEQLIHYSMSFDFDQGKIHRVLGCFEIARN